MIYYTSQFTAKLTQVLSSVLSSFFAIAQHNTVYFKTCYSKFFTSTILRYSSGFLQIPQMFLFSLYVRRLDLGLSLIGYQLTRQTSMELLLQVSHHGPVLKSALPSGVRVLITFFRTRLPHQPHPSVIVLSPLLHLVCTTLIPQYELFCGLRVSVGYKTSMYS